MSILSSLLKKDDQTLSEVAEGLKSIAENVDKLATHVAELTKVVKTQDLLLSEMYYMQAQLMKMMVIEEVPDPMDLDGGPSKPEKPN